jgi:hypothetical protein
VSQAHRNPELGFGVPEAVGKNFERDGYMIVKVFLIGIVLFLSAFDEGVVSAMQESGKPPKVNNEQCLECHGPYEKLIKATSQWKTPGGETVTPHQYVPHATKAEIPKCTECHTPHVIPLQDKASVIKPKDVDYCYSVCHHMRNLQKCQDCHHQ